MPTRRPFSLAFLLVNLALAGLFVTAPLGAPAGSLRGLDGAVNLVDHADRWSALPTWAGVAYAIGDLTCHQMESRSLHVGGNQFPVDARMLAMFTAGNVGFVMALRPPDGPYARDSLLGWIPDRLGARLNSPPRRKYALALLLAASLLPTAIDGTVQLVTPYESTNALRLITGAVLGLGGALWLGLVFDALAHPLPSLPEKRPAGPIPAIK